MDAAKEASSLGIDKDFARNYTADAGGTANLFKGVGAVVGVMRSAKFDRRKRDKTFETAMSALDMAEKKDKADS